MRLQKDTFHLILAMLVFNNSVTSKNSSVTYRMFLFFPFFSLHSFFFLLKSCFELWQGDFEFCVFVLYYFGANRSHYSLQHWVELRWHCFHRLWLVHCLCFHHDCRAFNGGDLLILSHFWWALLLERQACWAQMGSLRFMDHRLVPFPIPLTYFPQLMARKFVNTELKMSLFASQATSGYVRARECNFAVWMRILLGTELDLRFRKQRMETVRRKTTS